MVVGPDNATVPLLRITTTFSGPNDIFIAVFGSTFSGPNDIFIAVWGPLLVGPMGGLNSGTLL